MSTRRQGPPAGMFALLIFFIIVIAIFFVLRSCGSDELPEQEAVSPALPSFGVSSAPQSEPPMLVSPPPSTAPTPTPTPTPTLDLEYDTFSSSAAGFAFSKPTTWIQTQGTVAEFVQYVEPSAEASAREDSGYPTRLTIVKYQKGTPQTADDARDQLTSVVQELASEFQEMTVNDTYGSLSMGGGNGYYVYYRGVVADPANPAVTYSVRGRAGVVAIGQALYQIRISTPANLFEYYQDVYRTARNSFDVL